MAPRVSETNLKFTMLSSKARKTQLGMLRRRRLTLFKKLNEYHRLSNAEVYTLIYVHGRFYEYSTTRRPHWPPAKDQIVKLPRYIYLYIILTIIRHSITRYQLGLGQLQRWRLKRSWITRSNAVVNAQNRTRCRTLILILVNTTRFAYFFFLHISKGEGQRSYK